MKNIKVCRNSFFILFGFISFINDGIAQKTNRSDFSLHVITGYATGKKTGASTGVSVSWQENKNLFSFSLLDSKKYPLDFSRFPKVTAKDYRSFATLLSVLYGRCFYASNKVYSFSAGPSWNFYAERMTDNNNSRLVKSNAAGLLLEGAVKKTGRKRDSSGSKHSGKTGLLKGSFGIKVFGNLNKWGSFAGAGIIFGIDYKK